VAVANPPFGANHIAPLRTWPALSDEQQKTTNAIPGKRKSKEAQSSNSNKLSVPWTAPAFVAVKGIVYAPHTTGPTLTSDTCETLLNAIAKARQWMDGITSGRVKSFADIATKEISPACAACVCCAVYCAVNHRRGAG
jgi:hypothetical protein